METAQNPCCICERPGTRALGRRWYCDEHFAVVNKPHPGFWRAAVAQIAGLVVFIEAWYAQITSYATAMALTAISVFALAFIMTLVGHEKHGADLRH